jgi:beta-lactamase superfamily II metal-dependent hydrolase
MPSNQNSPPLPDELELSVFGPGYGECLVVHLGSDSWMVIDSCAGQQGDSAALDYLTSLGVKVDECVKLIVASHWHDDHIQGLAAVVRSCASAKFVCSAALNNKEFATLLAAGKNAKLIEHSSGTAEFMQVLEELENRHRKRSHYGPDHWATEGTLLHASTVTSPVEVFALSPSAQTITDAHMQLQALMPAIDEPTRRVPTFTPNDLSVAIVVKAEGVQLLLGADLEAGNDTRRGWLAVIGSPVAASMACQTYKVAHHGSDDADHDDIWAKLLTENPTALLTPYARGKKVRPTDIDVSRIKARGASAFCTTWPPTARNKDRRAINSTIRAVTKTHRTLQDGTGHLRMRVPFSGPCHSGLVEYFDGAVPL